jgi:hypothetical protein
MLSWRGFWRGRDGRRRISETGSTGWWPRWGCVITSTASRCGGGFVICRVVRYLAEFRAIAAPYAGSVSVKEFDAKHRDLLAPILT